MRKSCPDRSGEKHFPRAVLVLLILITAAAGSCTGGSAFPRNPQVPEDGDDAAEGPWEEVLASDPGYPDSLYLTEVVEFHPGQVGIIRSTYTPQYYDQEGRPLQETAAGACGPPEGCSVMTSNGEATMSVMGSGGWAVWRFEPGRMVTDGQGDDFVTFSNHNVLNGEPDGSWNELGRIFVSPDNVSWYENGTAAWDVNDTPGEENNGYVWSRVSGLHGNNHAWANFRDEVQAQELDPVSGAYEDVIDEEGVPVLISRYFSPEDPFLGGDRFDLADFIHTGTGEPWPEGEGVRYLKLEDDPAILDGQDWNPGYMTGSRLMAAMGIHVSDDPEVP